MTKKILASSILLLALSFGACAKNTKNVAELPNLPKTSTSYISEKEFIGSKEEFQVYSNMFLMRDNFPASDQEYLDYIKMINGTLFQREFVESYQNSKKAITKKFKPDSQALLNKMLFGFYPQTAGYILVTDNPTSGIASGHTAIVHSGYTVVEALPNGGVQRNTGDWNIRYMQSNVYGLKVSGFDDSRHRLALDYAVQQEGKPYNWDFTDRRRTDKFHCSQLVWRAFYNLNVDLSANPFGSGVLPMDIFNSPYTAWIYSRK